ncbi:hypothetical protein SEUCBS140593_003694 [Sporothrix eucalyptigena]|uniref:Extracellular membrane protein CFEM domain-containing protein n=1 Tax=Sporothrix eucalyptigena TaxID=1812306 RepID=A0ABP0BH78_9PEZI
MATALAFLLLLMPSNATTIALPSEIVDFVPSCATSCLSTFIDANFPASVCGIDPTFQCLCAHTGTNGFTVGEGALACIASVDRTGQCTGTDAAATASSKAYSMCYGQTSAAPETHATIVATLVIPSQSQSTRTVTTTVAGAAEGGSGTEEKTTATSTTKTTSSSTRTSTSTRTTTESHLLTDSTHFATPTTSTSATTSLPTAKTTTSSAQTGATSDQNQPTSNTTTLSVAQIVGISVGTAAVLFAAIALSLYLRRVRLRRLRTVPKLTGDNRADSDDEAGIRKRFRPRTGHELQISVPMNLQAPQKQNAPPAFPWQEKNNNYPPRPLQNNNNQPVNGRYDLPRTRPLAPSAATGLGLQISTTPTNAQNVGPAAIDRRQPSQQTPSSRTPKSPISARTTAYPSYYGINPDDELPNFGYQQPPLPAQQTQQPPQRQQPAQPIQQPQNKLPTVFQPPPTSRDSVVTEFAEDGEDMSPRGDDTYPLFRQIQTEAQATPQSRPQLQPLPQFQVQQHEPQLRPQPRTPPMRGPVDGDTRPFMSPSLVPRPLELPRNSGPPRNPGKPTLVMPQQAGSNVSRMAKMRLGDERAMNLRLEDNRRPQRPRQNAGWQRMEDDSRQY